ncbi:MAG: cobalamin-dependent protein, partial [Thermoplasmata archaeon]|nr:cobalamin-dependent protein [Thermoplasmata archaeon]
NILLVEPNFPIPPKSKNHKNFLPIGLLKIATYLRDQGHRIKLLRGVPKKLDELAEIKNFNPHEIWVTSLFTYWANYVRDAVQFYKKMFPKAIVRVGGIYASLFPENDVKRYTGCDKVHKGVIPEVENYAEMHFPAYDLIKEKNPHPIDYQIIHTSRGCPRKCPFCGTWKIEPRFIPKKSIRTEIRYKKIVIYDNNFLMNPYIEDILNELIDLKKKRKIEWVESQSGFDGRVLIKKPYLAKMIKEAGFRFPRIAWDWEYKQYPLIKKQIDLLKSAGYSSKEIFVFMLYNWNISFEEMERKRIKCWEWKVQIADCRYRPLNQLFDNYNPRVIGQTKKNYYIHEKGGWTDALIKQFRKNVREQNICVRHGFPFYSRDFERKAINGKLMKKVKALNNIEEKKKFLDKIGADYWFPNQVRYPSNYVKPLLAKLKKA